MYTEIGAIGSSSDLRLDVAFFGGSEVTGFDFAPTLADLEEVDPFFRTHVRQPVFNKQATLPPADPEAAAKSKK